MEVWKDVSWYEWLYQVSNLGRIKSLPKIWKWWHNWKILKWQNDKDWYLLIWLFKDKKCKKYKIHRLVMFVFNWESNLDVNHKNWIKTDNRLENLEYCTRKFNINHSFNELWRKSSNLWKFWKDNHKSKQILQYTKDWEFVKIWDSMMDIERVLQISHKNIWLCCKNKIKSCWWFIWKYKEQ